MDNNICTSFLDVPEDIRGEVQTCERDVQDLQKVTSQTYEEIAANLPKIIECIDSDKTESRALIAYFITGDDSANQSSVVGSTFKDTQENAEVADSINEMRRVDTFLIEKMRCDVDKMMQSLGNFLES